MALAYAFYSKFNFLKYKLMLAPLLACSPIMIPQMLNMHLLLIIARPAKPNPQQYINHCFGEANFVLIYDLISLGCNRICADTITTLSKKKKKNLYGRLVFLKVMHLFTHYFRTSVCMLSNEKYFTYKNFTCKSFLVKHF